MISILTKIIGIMNFSIIDQPYLWVDLLEGGCGVREKSQSHQKKPPQPTGGRRRLVTVGLLSKTPRPLAGAIQRMRAVHHQYIPTAGCVSYDLLMY